MRVYRSIEEFSATNPVITIGMFDGVHAGHCSILRQLNDERAAGGGESALLTFWPHPRMHFGAADGFSLLTSIDEKLQLLEANGLDACLILPFSSELANLSPERYITEILHQGMHARKIIVGHDHRYGKNGSGTFELLRQFGDKLGFSVGQVQAFHIDGEVVSSTKIREAIASGNIQRANRLLQYDYFLSGTVVPGQQIGRTLGFPTANLRPSFPFKQIPAAGVYAARAVVGGQEYAAVVNIGQNPTLGTALPLSIEAHLIDFSGNLYGETLLLRFRAFLRPEQRFPSLESLKKAIANDVEAAKRMR